MEILYLYDLFRQLTEGHLDFRADQDISVCPTWHSALVGCFVLNRQYHEI